MHMFCECLIDEHVAYTTSGTRHMPRQCEHVCSMIILSRSVCLPLRDSTLLLPATAAYYNRAELHSMNWYMLCYVMWSCDMHLCLIENGLRASVTYLIHTCDVWPY